MSHNNALPPLSRPPCAQTTAGGGSVVAAGSAVDGDGGGGSGNGDDDNSSTHSSGRIHDHSRPFPPPRLPPIPPLSTTATTATTTTTTTTAVSTGTPRIPLTAPLSPLSSSFRSGPSLRQSASTETTSTDARSLLSPSSESSGPPRSPVGEVSLAMPRPDGERAINEYVEAPFKNSHERRLEASKHADCPKIERRRHKSSTKADAATLAATHRQRRFNATTSASGHPVAANSVNSMNASAVTKQPVSFTKEPANALGSRTYDPAGLSIMCDFCGRCRCESCREPPPLPSRWLCDNSCFCSAETILDYASCLCCVKGMFYHCVDAGGGGGLDSESGGNCADEPCSCTGSRKASRWACLGALTLVMPCLLCYWPFKGCVALCEACYARHAAQGCRCNPSTIAGTAGRHHQMGNDISDSRDPEKRLLDPVTPEL